MKSTKKRFKLLLASIEQSASDLMLLSTDITLLEDVRVMADKALRACRSLRRRAGELRKKDFVEQILLEDALLQLDELVDQDLISKIEERFSLALPGPDSSPLVGILHQLLDKLEKHCADMNESIQQLGALLNAS